MTTLVNQPTARMTRKQYWTTMATGAMTVMFWGLDKFADVTAEPLVVGAAVGMAGASVGYFVRERASV